MMRVRVTVPLLLNVGEGTREGVAVDGAEEEAVGEGEADKRDQVSEKKMQRAARSVVLMCSLIACVTPLSTSSGVSGREHNRGKA